MLMGQDLLKKIVPLRCITVDSTERRRASDKLSALHRLVAVAVPDVNGQESLNRQHPCAAGKAPQKPKLGENMERCMRVDGQAAGTTASRCET